MALVEEVEEVRNTNATLCGEIDRLGDYELKFKIAQMLVDDDPAIDELLEAKSAYSMMVMMANADRTGAANRAVKRAADVVRRLEATNLLQ